jgi:hypothetical protein
MFRPDHQQAQMVSDGAMAEEIRASANATHSKAMELRTAARRDAIVAVARARERRGAPPAAWTAFDADAVFLFADLLTRLHGGKEEPLDPAFGVRDAELARSASIVSRVEEALKHDPGANS